MGQRANLVMIESKEIKIYYSHWKASYVPNILAQGLDFCRYYFPKFDESKFLLDNAWSEGLC